VNGEVLTQPATPVDTTENTYNAQGVSNLALEMVENTRAENAKFGEVWIHGEDLQDLQITYANGFIVIYQQRMSDGHMVEKPGSNCVSPPAHQGELLFQYFNKNLKSEEEIENYLFGLGLGFKSGYDETSGGWIKLEDGHRMSWHSDLGSIVLHQLQGY